MPFIPHTADDVRDMQAIIGVTSIDALFDEIPAALRAGSLTKVPDGRSEMDMLALLADRADRDRIDLCFTGAGSYDHHIPAAVWDIAQRGEFLTAYTPYQAEASQGTLQLIYEFQSMMTALTGMDVSNASVYDGGSGLAEAVLMAVRANKKNKSRHVAMPDTVNPRYHDATRAIVRNQQIELTAIPMAADGTVDIAALKKLTEIPVALVVQHPNYFGRLEDVDALADWAAEHAVALIASVNPLSLAVLKPPSEWGKNGADIVCGDGQPFGIPMASGGPSFGFMCCKMDWVRQMPGRIIGRTVDLEGKTGFALTLQAREQHIRRAKATSNICTNQGLLVTAGTIYMSILGAEGLRQVATSCHGNTQALTDALTKVPGVTIAFDGPFFHERVVRLPVDATTVVERLAAERILIGHPLGREYPKFSNHLLICATEKYGAAAITRAANALTKVLGGAR
jgi:glycine dehydrogenase subunit 1